MDDILYGYYLGVGISIVVALTIYIYCKLFANDKQGVKKAKGE